MDSMFALLHQRRKLRQIESRVIVVEQSGLGGGLVTTTVTISVADWAAGTSVVKTVAGVTATNLIWVAPSPDSYNKCAEFEIRASAQGIDQLTFVATSTPDAEVVMNVVIGADQ